MLLAANSVVDVTFLNVPTDMRSSSTQRPFDLAQPLLSVLIPAYNYADGVMRIVVPLMKEGRTDLEILIHDDSSDDQVERAVQSFPGLCYVRNRPSRGAIDNWNGLLASARGHYILLVHHDDYPLSEQFASELIADLESYAWPDILLLSCATHNVVRDRMKMGVCNWIRLLVARRLPFYLFRRNVIGPPAAMVVRRDLFESFDGRLKWLVDVEAYYRLFVKGSRSIQCSRLVMVSSTGLPGAITTGIQDDKSSIASSELAYIAAKFSRGWRRRSLCGQLRGARLISNLEWLLWIWVKAVSAASRLVAGRPRISLAMVQRRRSNCAENTCHT